MSARGCFIVVEGPDGAGKTTLTGRLVERMEHAGVVPVRVREPGGTPLAEALRRELLDSDGGFSNERELLYILTARADLVVKVILPALEQGRLVISDRYDLSTLAYQGGGRGLPVERIEWLNRAATGGLAPDVTLVLDLPAAAGRARQAASGKNADRMEREDHAFHDRVAATYLAADGPGVHHLDAAASPEEVLEAAWQIISTGCVGHFRPASEKRL